VAQCVRAGKADVDRAPGGLAVRRVLRANRGAQSQALFEGYNLSFCPYNFANIHFISAHFSAGDVKRIC
jgi:hypothetical protein